MFVLLLPPELASPAAVTLRQWVRAVPLLLPAHHERSQRFSRFLAGRAAWDRKGLGVVYRVVPGSVKLDVT